MKIILLSGFLGSGKTTALSGAAISLMKQGKRVGVITNDQGKYQVDSHFIDAQGIPVVEVSNGCFCCNYETLDKQIISLDKNQKPDYIFAESVGSCTDLIATVLKPLQAYRDDLFELITLSTFTDSRLMYQHLMGRTLPFSQEVNYIIHKQMEEADMLVVNKIDLLTEEQLKYIKENITNTFPHKRIIYQNSLDITNLDTWIQTADATPPTQQRQSLEVDYDTYGAGEALLGWLDDELEITGINAGAATQQLITQIKDLINKEAYAIGHLKFMASDGFITSKQSFTSLENKHQQGDIEQSKSQCVSLIINARIETTPKNINSIIQQAIKITEEKLACNIKTKHHAAFVPGYPKPTHRII